MKQKMTTMLKVVAAMFLISLVASCASVQDTPALASQAGKKHDLERAHPGL